MTVRSKELAEFLRLMENLDEAKKQEMVLYLRELHNEQEAERNPATGLSPLEVIKISRHLPISTFEPAEEIAMEFRNRVYIPQCPEMFVDFLRMIAAIWQGGYIAGVRAERRKKRSRS